MALDPRIILAGQQPDIVNVLAQSNQAAQQQINNQSQNALAGYARQNGAAIMQGDQNALAGLAGQGVEGLNAAIGIQDKRYSREMDQQKMAILTREEARTIEDRARQMSKEERELLLAQTEQDVKMGLALPNAQEWDKVMAEQAPDLVGQFDNREALAQRFMSMADIIKKTAGPEYRRATPEEAAQYGSAGGQINLKTGKFDPINPPSGMSIKTNPDGTMSLTQGPGAGTKPLTEGQGKDNVFATRAEGALRQLEPVADSLANRADIMAESVPLGFGREMQNQDFQVAKQAGDEFLQALLRKDTGAAITTQEQAMYGTTYLPQPGDGPAVLAAKRESRARALEALRSGMSVEQITMTEQALVKAAERNAGSGPQPGIVEDGFRFIGGNPADPSSWEQVQ